MPTMTTVIMSSVSVNPRWRRISRGTAEGGASEEVGCRRMRRIMVALSLLLAGCRACTAQNEQPPPDVVEAEVKKELAAHPEKVKTLCGVSVPALRDIIVKIE